MSSMLLNNILGQSSIYSTGLRALYNAQRRRRPVAQDAGRFIRLRVKEIATMIEQSNRRMKGESIQTNIDGWQYRSDLGGIHYVVYTKGRNCVFAFRGTTLTGPERTRDLIQDGLILFGREEQSPQMPVIINQIVRDIRILKNEGIRNYSFCGYSLGGARAYIVWRRLFINDPHFRFIGLNAPLPLSFYQYAGGGRAVMYRTPKDVVSLRTPAGKGIKIVPQKDFSSNNTVLDAHSIDNFM